jgi:hypothetical protein
MGWRTCGLLQSASNGPAAERAQYVDPQVHLSRRFENGSRYVPLEALIAAVVGAVYLVETAGKTEHMLLAAQSDAAMLTKAVLPSILFDVGHGAPQRRFCNRQDTMIRSVAMGIIIKFVEDTSSEGNWATHLRTSRPKEKWSGDVAEPPTMRDLVHGSGGRARGRTYRQAVAAPTAPFGEPP